MATRAYVLSVDAVETTTNGAATLAASGVYCHDDSAGSAPFTVNVPFLWADTANQIGTKLRNAILANAAASQYDVQTIVSIQFAKL